MTNTKIAFTMYPARDLARARRFYEHDLGLAKTGEFAEGRWPVCRRSEREARCFVWCKP